MHNEKAKIKQWKNKLKARSNLFFRHNRNKILIEIFTSEIRKANPKVPRKFLSHFHKHDTQEEKKIKKQLAIEKIKTEIHLQGLRSERQLKQLQKLDEEMCNHINKNFSQIMSQQLTNEWVKECKIREKQAVEKFHNKINWLKARWIQFNAEKQHSNYKKYNKPLGNETPKNRLNKKVQERSFSYNDTKQSTNQRISNHILLRDPPDLHMDKETQNDRGVDTFCNNISCNTELFSLTLSELEFNSFFQPYLTLENLKINWLEKNNNNTNFIAKTKLLFYLQKISRKELRNLSLTFNRRPGERKKLDVIIATADEKNLTSLKQSYDNVKQYKKDGNLKKL